MINILKNNLALKVISVLFAIILWAYVVSDQNPISTRPVRSIDVDMQGITVLAANNLTIINERDYTVDVKISGRRNDIINIKSSDMKAIIEVGHINTKGKVSLPVSVGGLPENVEVVQVEPSSIELEIDNVIEIQVPVELRVSGAPKRDHIRGQYTVDPDEVRVRGPESIVTRIKSAVAEINIDGSTDAIIKTVPIRLLDSDNNQISEGVEITKEFVSVEQDILFTKDIEIKPNVGRPIGENYLVSSIVVTPKTLKVAGKKSVLDGVTEISTEPIDLSQITQDAIIEVDLIIPQRINPVDKIGKVKVDVKVKEKEQERTMTVNTLHIENIEEGYTGNIPSMPIEITFKGPINKVEATTGDDISIYIDGAGLPSGSYRLPIKAALPEGLELIDWNPKEVDVIIKASE